MSAQPVSSALAHLRNRGLQRFNVRDLSKARTVLLWRALANTSSRVGSSEHGAVFMSRLSAGEAWSRQARPVRPRVG